MSERVRSIDQRTRQLRGPEPAPGAAPPPRAAVIALQRSNGNQAVVRMLQRKSGFEFEADAWWSWKRTRPFSDAEATQPTNQRKCPPT